MPQNRRKKQTDDSGKLEARCTSVGKPSRSTWPTPRFLTELRPCANRGQTQTGVRQEHGPPRAQTCPAVKLPAGARSAFLGGGHGLTARGPPSWILALDGQAESQRQRRKLGQVPNPTGGVGSSDSAGVLHNQCFMNRAPNLTSNLPSSTARVQDDFWQPQPLGDTGTSPWQNDLVSLIQAGWQLVL